MEYVEELRQRDRIKVLMYYYKLNKSQATHAANIMRLWGFTTQQAFQYVINQNSPQ